MIKCFIYALLAFLVLSTFSVAGELDLQVEGGALWFSKNDVRIPGDTGTKFHMLELTGSGPDPYLRLYATYDFNSRHAIRLTYAPVQVDGQGMLNEDVTFKDDVFSANAPTKGTYKFNTSRLTYRWTLDNSNRWRWGIGAALLVRDADITLEQADKKQSRDDLGFVPLFHFYGEYLFTDQFQLNLDVEGAWAPMGRAVDAAVKAQYEFDSGWYLGCGYRSLEGGADNDDVYTFAWLHYALVESGYRF